ncbi:MAG: HAD family phosphatase [Mycoplasma sp.]|nr:HAD family phosphatase [Mycoplasma sp.]
MNKEKLLFAIDLDGTLLSNSATGEMHSKTEEQIKRAIKEGHVVCIITGRPWRSTEPIYNQLGLNTIVGNYNGAHIHNPSDYSFIPYISYLNLNEIMYILGDPKIKSSISNLAIEGPGWVQLEKMDEDLAAVFGFKDANKLKVGINFNKLPLKPTGIIFDTKKGLDVVAFSKYLKQRYGDLAEFSSWSKGENMTPVFDITSVGATKSKVVSLLGRYYDIEVDRIFTFGDGYNDLPMFEAAGISIAMKNSSQEIKNAATIVTKNTNKEGGVGYYMEYLLDNLEKELERVSKIQKEKDNKINEKIT